MKLEPREVFEKLCRLDPESPLSHFTLGRAHYQHADYPLAIAALNEALRLDPNYLLGYLILAQSYEKQGNVAEAKRIYQEGERRAKELDESAFAAQFRALRLTMVGS